MDTDRGSLDDAARISADWLSLREAADATAREVTRAAVADLLARRRPTTVIDVGCGTGAGGRWLQPLLVGDETWMLLDHDPDLLEQTAGRLRARGASGTIRTRRADVSELEGILAELTEEASGQRSPAEATARHDADQHEGDQPTSTEVLVIASALLDLLTAAQIRNLLAAADQHGADLLVALTVTGGMRCDPPHPADDLITGAFNRHQRHGQRCGPEALGALQEAAAELGVEVTCWETPWVLDSSSSALLEQLVKDRAVVAEEQLRAESADAAAADATAPGDRQDVISEVHQWRDIRMQQSAEGLLDLQIDHVDVLVGRAGLEPATKRL